jgi:hypothetical protein
VLELKEKRERRSRPINWKWALYAIYLGAAGLLAAGGLTLYHARPLESSAKEELVSIGQSIVRNDIREELKTNFSSAEETRVEALPDHKFLIAGWVDVIAEDGDISRQEFSCVIYKSDAENWIGERISVIPQQL